MARPLPFALVLRTYLCALTGLVSLAVLPLAAQVFTVTDKPSGPIDRRFLQVEATKVDLPKDQINARGHQDILRVLVAEQGFAMRPLPRGKHGLTLEANGKLAPVGERYVNEVTVYGLSVKPGDRVVFSNVRIEKASIIFDINGGPQRKHEFLRHIQIGMGGDPNNPNDPNAGVSPIIQGEDQEPTGARIVLTFHDYVPDVTPAQVKALLAPLVSFEMKTPVQAFTDTLPPQLKKAILDHNVMVGMNTDMVLYAMGQPDAKSREMEGQMPFEEWIYGKPPADVRFVRVNGNRVIRVEVAKLGQPLEIHTQDEVAGLMMSDGRSVTQVFNAPREKKVEMGDYHPDLDRQAAAPAPSLRKQGEKLPQDADMNKGVGDDRVSREQTNGPVQFPKDTNKDPAHTLDVGAARRAEQAAKAAGGSQPKDTRPADAAKPAATGAAPQPSAPAQTAPPQTAPAQPAPAKPGPAPQPPPASNFLDSAPAER